MVAKEVLRNWLDLARPKKLIIDLHSKAFAGLGGWWSDWMDPKVTDKPDHRRRHL
jgi:hypothetical protein